MMMMPGLLGGGDTKRLVTRDLQATRAIDLLRQEVGDALDFVAGDLPRVVDPQHGQVINIDPKPMFPLQLLKGGVGVLNAAVK